MMVFHLPLRTARVNSAAQSIDFASCLPITIVPQRLAVILIAGTVWAQAHQWVR
jgi:hypothetical protein